MSAVATSPRNRPLDAIPASDLFTGKVSPAELAAIEVARHGPRIPYGQIRAAFDAMMHAAAWYAKLPWEWLARAGTLTVAADEADSFASQLAENHHERGARH